jgi:hypothetical protein
LATKNAHVDAELSPNARAGCKNTECKKEGVKIMKDELRFATLVTIKEHTSWMYKHWYDALPLSTFR